MPKMNNKTTIHAAGLVGAMVTTGLSMTVLASPPLVTDDASTLDPGACQIEFESRRFKRLTEIDVVPACNLFADTELAIGGCARKPMARRASMASCFRSRKY